MIRLSVNVNKVATLRNSRGGSVPSVGEAARVILDAGAGGITVHPRHDARHITTADVRELAAMLAPLRGFVEYNIEGDVRPDLMALVREVRPDQCTLVPVLPGEVTSQGGWPASTPLTELREVVADLRGHGIRVSIFINPTVAAVEWAAALGCDRVELFTEPFAKAWNEGPGAAQREFEVCAAAAEAAHAAGLGVNAGHDLTHENLKLFRNLPHLAEVSIGHALISRALFRGLGSTVRDYLQVLAGTETR